MIFNALEQLTQQNSRLITFDSPLPPEQELRLENFSGREAISELFAFEATLISSDARIELKKLVGKKVSLGLTLADGNVRHFNAHVSDFVHLGADGGVASYHARLVPWVWLLSRRSDSRVFQDKTVEEVVREIFSYYQSLAVFEFRLTRPLKKMSYCTQYMESDLNFILRLLEAEGLFFTFQHSQDEHCMMIMDDSRDLPALPAQPVIRYHRASVTEEADSITTWSSSRNLQPTQLAMKSFDYKQPRDPQLVQMKSIAKQGEVGEFETFDYEGVYGYTDLEDGQQKARNRLEAMEVLGKQFSGSSNCRVMEPGYFFELTQHYDHDQDSQEDRQFLLLSVNHSGQNNYLSHGEPGYQNSFECIRRKIPYRHRLSTPRAAIRGPQTAIIVGPPGEEIYTDEMGRVKVQFHWDRYGQFDDKSSCWVRVAQSGASGGFGSIQIPRVGDEVVVVFLDGNPDRPLIMGSLYNSQNTPPWSLPANKTQSGFLTRSMKGHGGTANFFRFEDKAGAEQVIMHAERNMDTEIEFDETHKVGNNRLMTIDGMQTEIIKKDAVMNVQEGSLTIQVDNQFIQVNAKQHIILQVGESSITLTPDGIEIKGNAITTVSKGTTQITGAAVRVND
ncbi:MULTISPECIES: type VI secretion system Vgr family protein [Pseudomonas syringae group]|uniref:Type VI secretion system Vgr family protein n=5 Tax=Pseudomonas syringae group TaxID=136849 RepID=F3G2P1_PSESJ|nr:MULTISPECIES: type VI secretion system tip protein VgrG [Pseudomonas syringae group]EGH41341.1 type VI secretion system Vgr family protein [Pseudomonas syringae pv. pisi str. 1704B]PYD10690.1 type VI secretion system tip protein VgrG [Pseudomonas syringae pv. pisi]PYD28386.1 type VI secretion system tip protein VgrG [Pseudomonas syringae pv. pisi]PYD29888.1 type VI secretion system tip protein VgrG [Pseudomonas syringae pv. pisi]